MRHLARLLPACLIVLAAAPPAPAAEPLTAAALVDSVPRTVELAGAEDLLAEARYLAGQIVADGRHYPAGAYMHGQYATMLTCFGRNVAAMAQLLEFLPGDLAKPASPKGALAAYLAREVRHLLDERQYAWEESGSLGYRAGTGRYNVYGPIVLAAGVEAIEEPYAGEDYREPWKMAFCKLPDGTWTGQRLGVWMASYSSRHTISRWEGLYGLWAYAHYTGDWAFIRENWETIRAIRARAPAEPVKNDYPPQGGFLKIDGTNSWIAGLVGYARLAAGVGDASERQAAEAELERAIRKRVELGCGGTVITYAFNDTQYHDSLNQHGIQYWWEFTPELGRLLRDRFPEDLARRADELRRGQVQFFYLSDLSLEHTGENQGQHPWVSVQVYQGLACAWAQVGEDGSLTYPAEARARLREMLPEASACRAMPYHMDMYRLQNLVALLRAHGRTTWQPAGQEVRP